MSGWAIDAKRTIRRVITENPGLGWPAMLAKVNKAYPFGWRGQAPYKIWLKARAKAMGEYAAMIGDSDPTRRVCPACGAGLGRRCSKLDGEKRAFPSPLVDDFHESRRQVAAPSGPLFAAIEGA